MNDKRVAPLMRAEGLRARPRKCFRSTTRSEDDQPVAANMLDRQFVSVRPNQHCFGETTEVVVDSSAKLYLAATLNLCSGFHSGVEAECGE